MTPKVLTFSRNGGVHLRSPDQATIFTELLPNGALVLTPDGTRPNVLIVPQGFSEPITQARYGQIIAPPPVVQPINWQSPPQIPGGSGDYMIPPGNYINEDITKPMFRVKFNSTTPGRLILTGSRCRSVTPIFSGFQGKATATNNILEIIPHNIVGRDPARLLNMEECWDLVFERNTVLNHGAGIYITGTAPNNTGPKFFAGSVANGDGVTVRYNIIRNVDGRIYGRKSNWTPTKNRDGFLASGAQYGAVVANFIQFNGTPAMPRCLVEWNEVLSDLGCFAEDMISMFGGSGGRPDAWALFRNNLISNTGGYDWNFVEGVSTVYDASQKITLNADAGNTAAQMVNAKGESLTAYSGTTHLVGDGTRTDAYLNNSCYVRVEKLVSIGYRSLLSIQSGHHNVLENNEVYVCDRHHSGIPYTNSAFTGYQITDYHPGTTANDNGQIIFGYNQMLNNRYFNGGSGLMGTAGHILSNNGVFEGNTLAAKVTDGGAARIIQFRQDAQAAGVTLGAVLAS